MQDDTLRRRTMIKIGNNLARQTVIVSTLEKTDNNIEEEATVTNFIERII